MNDKAQKSCVITPYRRRHPEQSLLYHVVQEHFETYLALARQDDWDGTAVPAYAEREFRRYLECGILAYGFARARCAQCGYDFLIAFSCKGRAVCPSCGTRRMTETAAHLVDHLIPHFPVRQWVLSLPKRLRWYLKADRAAINSVLHIFHRVIRQELAKRIPAAADKASIGGVSFIHRFGDSLNEHIHFHCCIIDALFWLEDGKLHIEQLSGLSHGEVATMQTIIAKRVLRWFARRGLLEPEDARAMLEWASDGGFSLNASVRIEDHDRKGLERLIRYCARPPFALDRIEAIDEEHLLYHLAKPQFDGTTTLQLTPMELIDRLVALVPPPRMHRHRYHGVLAPNSPLRRYIVTLRESELNQVDPVKEKITVSTDVEDSQQHSGQSSAHYFWAMLIARIFETLPLICPHCGAEMEIIAFITETVPKRAILESVNEPSQPPVITAARGPPAWDEMAENPIDWEQIAQLEEEYQYNQDVAW